MIHQIAIWPTALILIGLTVFTADSGLPGELPQTPAPLAQYWEDLGAADAEVAYRSIGYLVKNPDGAVKLLNQNLKVAKAPDQARMESWFKDLSSPKFSIRERAFQRLRGLDIQSASFLRKALDKEKILETRLRVKKLLEALEHPLTSPQILRQIRGIEVLEMIGCPNAKKFLRTLAEGYTEDRQTQQAKEALQRLRFRHPIPESWRDSPKNTRLISENKDPLDSLPFGAIVRMGSTLFRHLNVNSNGFSPDSRKIISHDQRSIYVRETKTGKVQRKFEITAQCSAVAPKGTLMAIGVFNKAKQTGKLLCLDWKTGQEREQLQLPPQVSPRRLAFAPDGDKVYCHGSDESLRSWDIKSGQVSILWEPGKEKVKLLAWSPEGSLAVFGSGKENFLINLHKKGEKRKLPSMFREARLATISPDGKNLAIAPDYADFDRLLICDAASGKVIWRSGAELGAYVNSACFSPDGKILGVGSYNKEIALWNLHTGKYLRSLPGSRNHSISAISPDGRWLSSSWQTTGVWDLETGNRVSVGSGHKDPLNAISFSPRYDLMATMDYHEIHLWDPITGKHKGNVVTGGDFARGIALSPDCKLVAAAQPGPGEGYLKIWETATGRLRFNLPGHGLRDFGRAADVQFTPDGNSLFSWGDDGFLRKWDVRTGKALMEIQTLPVRAKRDFRETIPQQGWKSRCESFLLLEENGHFHSFDLKTGKKSPMVKFGSPSFAFTNCFSPTGKMLASYNREIGLLVRDTNSGKLIFSLALPDFPRKLAFSPDGRTLAAALEDQVILIEMATGKVRLKIEAMANALIFTPDCRFLVRGMADTTALVWDLAQLAEGKNEKKTGRDQP